MSGNKVVSITGAATPQTVVSGLSEHLEEIEGVLGVVLWEGGQQSVFCTNMPAETITWLGGWD